MSFRALEKQGAFHDFYGVAADADGVDAVGGFAGADEEIAGAVGFDALADQDLLIGFGHAMEDHPGGGAARGGAGGGVLANAVDIAGAEADFGVAGFTRDVVEVDGVFADGGGRPTLRRRGWGTREVGVDFVEVGVEALQGFQAANGDDGERQSRGDGLDGEVRIEIVGVETDQLSYLGSVVGFAEDGVELRHLAEGAGGVIAEGDGDFAGFQVEGNGGGMGQGWT